MAARLVSVDRNTPMLLPPDPREWVPEDDLVHFVIEAVDRLPLESFRGFSLRGKEKVSGEWTLVCPADNLRCLHRMACSVPNGAGCPKSTSMSRKTSEVSPVDDRFGEMIHVIFPRSIYLAAESSTELSLLPTGS